MKSFVVRLRSAREAWQRVGADIAQVRRCAAAHVHVAMLRHESASFKCFSFQRCSSWLARGVRDGKGVVRLPGHWQVWRGVCGRAPV